MFGNHMKKTVIAACATVASLSLLLAGCGTDSSSGKTQIRFATWDVAEDVDRQQTLVDQFNESHDDIEVTLEAYGSDFDTKISAGMGSNDTPDVMYMWNYPSYADGLEPLDSYIEKEGSDWKSDFYSTLWNYNSYDGKTYGAYQSASLRTPSTTTRICSSRPASKRRPMTGLGPTCRRLPRRFPARPMPKASPSR